MALRPRLSTGVLLSDEIYQLYQSCVYYHKMPFVNKEFVDNYEK
jgi:hypothetical protein